MNVNDKLADFLEKFKEFKTKDNRNDFSEENTNFNFSEWIDKLKDDLFANNFKMAKDILKLTRNTPYAEFEFAWKYVQQVITRDESHFNWTDIVYPNEPDYYALQNLSTFVFSLLNRLTMDRYVLANENYMIELTKDLQEKGYTGQELGIKIRDKLKRVTFSNWRYNPLLKEYEKSFLWDRYLKEARNVNEHYGTLFKAGDPTKFDEMPETYYAEIILEVYIFLYYIKYYTLKYRVAAEAHGKEF